MGLLTTLAVANGVASQGGSLLNTIGGIFGGGNDSPALDLSFPLFDTKGRGFDENMKSNQIKNFKGILRTKFPNLANSNGFSESGWWNDKTSKAAQQIGIWSYSVNSPYGGITPETFNSIMAGTYNFSTGSVGSSSSSSSSSSTVPRNSSPSKSASNRPSTGIMDSVKNIFKTGWTGKDGVIKVSAIVGTVVVLWKPIKSLMSNMGMGSISAKNL